MGKGDKKSTRGKRVAGSYGKTRPRKKGSASVIPVKVLDAEEKKAPKAKVKKEVGEPVEKTENAEAAKKPRATKAKPEKAEEAPAAEKPKTTRKKKTEE